MNSHFLPGYRGKHIPTRHGKVLEILDIKRKKKKILNQWGSSKHYCHFVFAVSQIPVVTKLDALQKSPGSV